MEIEVKVTATTEVAVDVTVTPVEGRLPGPPDPRYRFVFSDDLVLERIDNKEPGNGLPQSSQNRLAGTHSGFATTLRVADANDKFFPEGSMLFQYEGTFMFDAVTSDLPNRPKPHRAWEVPFSSFLIPARVRRSNRAKATPSRLPAQGLG